jgi:GNAT superfamily N-acetyltransferase
MKIYRRTPEQVSALADKLRNLTVHRYKYSGLRRFLQNCCYGTRIYAKPVCGFVAYHDGEPVAWAAVDREHRGRFAVMLFVPPRLRHQGLGTRLVKRAVLHVGRKLNAYPPNKRARRFFRTVPVHIR